MLTKFPNDPLGIHRERQNTFNNRKYGSLSILFRDVQKRKHEQSKFDILKLDENIPFKFDYFAGNEVGGSFFYS